jgi:hypothetical protein
MELAIIAIPIITAPIDASGVIGRGASLLFIDSAMAVALMQARRSAMLFGVSDGIDYYAKKTNVGEAKDKVSSGAGSAVDAGKKIGK